MCTNFLLSIGEMQSLMTTAPVGGRRPRMIKNCIYPGETETLKLLALARTQYGQAIGGKKAAFKACTLEVCLTGFLSKGYCRRNENISYYTGNTHMYHTI